MITIQEVREYWQDPLNQAALMLVAGIPFDEMFYGVVVAFLAGKPVHPLAVIVAIGVGLFVDYQVVRVAMRWKFGVRPVVDWWS